MSKYRLVAEVPKKNAVTPGKSIFLNLHEWIEIPYQGAATRKILQFHCGPRDRDEAFFRFCMDAFKLEAPHVHLDLQHAWIEPADVVVEGMSTGFIDTIQDLDFIALVTSFINTGVVPVARVKR